MTQQILDLAEHEDFAAYTDSLPGELERKTLREGVASVLTEYVWAYVRQRMADDPGYRDAVRDTVEGDYADEPALEELQDPAGMQRYGSHAEAMDLIRHVGIEALLAAFFLGRKDRIAGPGRGPRSLLAPGRAARRTTPDLTGLTRGYTPPPDLPSRRRPRQPSRARLPPDRRRPARRGAARSFRGS